MPRGKRKVKEEPLDSLTDPVPIGDPLAEVIKRAGLVTAGQLPLPKPDQDTTPPPPERPPLPDLGLDPPMIPNGVPRTAETEVAETLRDSQGRSHVQRLSEMKGLRPTPTGFMGLESYRNVGIRLSRSLDKTVVAIQFADDYRPSRDGLNPETERLRDRGFHYVPMRMQWERVDRENLAENYQDAKTLVEALVKYRLAKSDELQR